MQDSAPIDDVPASPGKAGIGAVEGGIVAGSGKPEPDQSRPASATAGRSPPAGLTTTKAAPPVASASVTSPMSGGVTSSQNVKPQTGTRLVDSPLPISASTSPGTVPAGAFRNRTNTMDTNSAPVTESNTELKVGPNVYPVNPNDDPQRNRAPTNTTTLVNPNVGAQDDPIAQQLDILRNPSLRKHTSPSTVTTESKATAINKTVPPASGFTSNPPSASASAPTAVMMKPSVSRSPSPLPVEKVVENYAPRLPGEQRSHELSRENSLNHVVNAGQARREPSPAREVRPGIGAFGGSRSPSPHPQASVGYASTRSPQQQPQQAPPRNQTPLGIAIDESGRVRQDALLERMRIQENFAQPASVAAPQNQNYNAYTQHAVSPSAQYPQQPGRGYTQSIQQQPQIGRYDPRYQEYSSPNTYGAPPSGIHNVPPPPPLSTNPRAVDPRVQRGYYPEEYGQRGYSQGGYDPAYQEYGVTARTPSPPSAPTNQYTEDGKPVLFYGKAL